MYSTRTFIHFSQIALYCTLLSACNSLPDVNRILHHASSKHTLSQPSIIGAYGPLNAEQTQQLIANIAPDEAHKEALKKYLILEQTVAESPLVTGNKIRVLQDGFETFPAIFEAIRKAKHHINLEYYILENIEYQGVYLSDLLIEKRKQGVSIHIIYDSIGSIDTPSTFFDKLAHNGIKIIEFNPINPLEAHKTYSINDRDHRKILIVDGKQAIIGGVNLSTTYQSAPFTKKGTFDTAKDSIEYWRDTDIEIQGPVVAQLQKIFVTHWQEQKGESLDTSTFYPKIDAQGNEILRIMGSTPNHLISHYYLTLSAAMRHAQKRIWITAAYFVPTHEEKKNLIKAAQKGIDVQILLPSKSDSFVAIDVQHSYYADLLKAGVKIYERPNVILHSKIVMIDSVWTVIGSSNFDHRSVLFNDEVDAVILGHKTSQELERIFIDDTQKAVPIDLNTWKKRPWRQKMKERFSKLWQNLL